MLPMAHFLPLLFGQNERSTSPLTWWWGPWCWRQRKMYGSQSDVQRRALGFFLRTAGNLSRVNDILSAARERRGDEGAQCYACMRAHSVRPWPDVLSLGPISRPLVVQGVVRSLCVTCGDHVPPEVSWGEPGAQSVRRPPARYGRVVARALEAHVIE